MRWLLPCSFLLLSTLSNVHAQPAAGRAQVFSGTAVDLASLPAAIEDHHSQPAPRRLSLAPGLIELRQSLRPIEADPVVAHRRRAQRAPTNTGDRSGPGGSTGPGSHHDRQSAALDAGGPLHGVRR